MIKLDYEINHPNQEYFLMSCPFLQKNPAFSNFFENLKKITFLKKFTSFAHLFYKSLLSHHLKENH